MKSKKLWSAIVPLLLAVLLAGCACEHEWQPATCLAPRTCSRCNAVQGKIRSHVWGSTACNDPQPCIYCFTTEGMVLTHEWREDCRICIHCGKDERIPDERFMEKLTEGIDTRWSLKRYEDSTLTQEDWIACIGAEYDLLVPFLEETFRDPALGEAAREYIRCVTASMEAARSFDPETWDDVYTAKLFQEQCMALHRINVLRPVTVAEKHAARLEYTLNQGQVIEMIYPLFDEVLFLYIGGVAGQEKYETTLTNTTSLSFRKFTFEIDLFDEGGGWLATVESSVIGWDPGEKLRFSFQTDTPFHSMKVAFARWDF